MPVSFSPEVATQICEYIAEGKTLRRISKLEGMPSVAGIMKWLSEGDVYAANGEPEHPKALFVEQYARAITIRADTLFDETLDIADDNEHDSMLGDDGKVIYNLDHIQRMKLRVDTRKWMVAHLAPKKYRYKSEVEHNGGTTITVQLADYSNKKEI